jgi:hypothetical protein
VSVQDSQPNGTKKADYLFSLKKNSDLSSAETLYEDVPEYFKDLNFFPDGRRAGARFLITGYYRARPLSNQAGNE